MIAQLIPIKILNTGFLYFFFHNHLLLCNALLTDIKHKHTVSHFYLFIAKIGRSGKRLQKITDKGVQI
jgi:hypothetical protein